MSNKSVREPLFHVAKRGYVPKYKSWAIRLGSIVAALLVCAVVTMILTGVIASETHRSIARLCKSFQIFLSVPNAPSNIVL